jgi:hypothetical protein
MADEPRTLAEHLDVAADGEAFGRVVAGLFAVLERGMDDEMDNDE